MSRAEDLLGDINKDWSPTPPTSPTYVPPDAPVRERGASNVMMTDFGKHQLRSRGRGYGEQILQNAQTHGRMPKVQIHTSAWDRTQDSAKQIHTQLAAHGIPATINIVPDLAPQSTGELEGQESNKVADEVDRYRNEFRDVPFPGTSPMTGLKGESTDHYASRVVPVIDKLVKDSTEHPSTIHIVAAHSSDMKEIRRKYDPGFNGQDKIDPARTDLIHIADDGKPRYVPDVTIGGQRKLVPGVYLQHHGATEFNTERPELSILPSSQFRG